MIAFLKYLRLCFVFVLCVLILDCADQFLGFLLSKQDWIVLRPFFSFFLDRVTSSHLSKQRAYSI